MKRAVIDSLNITAQNIEGTIINRQDDYIIDIVKSKAIFEPHRWRQAFGVKLTRNITRACIIHTSTGLKIPLKTFSNGKGKQCIEFAGLHGYNERSDLLKECYGDLKSYLQDGTISRIDIAIDFEDEIPRAVIRKILSGRYPFPWKGSTYYKTAKEKRTNQKMDIKTYNKTKKEKLKGDHVLMRLEFCFKGAYLNGCKLSDLDTLFPKIKKSIKKFAGLNVKIEAI
jgi:hypothetical protein